MIENILLLPVQNAVENSMINSALYIVSDYYTNFTLLRYDSTDCRELVLVIECK